MRKEGVLPSSGVDKMWGTFSFLSFHFFLSVYPPSPQAWEALSGELRLPQLQKDPSFPP